MPSPFPGMDPYLEGPDWRSVHIHLAVEIARYLSPRLPDKYIVRAEKVYLLSDLDGLGVGDDFPASWHPPERRLPDVSVVATDVGDTAVATAPSPAIDAPLRLSLPPSAFREPEPMITVEVIDLADRSLVTAVEVLSATNKVGDGRAEYIVKRNRLLASDSHLMELDLLRSGRRVPMADPLPDVPYFVVLSRAGQRPAADVWPITVRQSLPAVPIPLRGGDPDVRLDLQDVLTTLYDVYRFGKELDYTRPPPVPLSPADAAWAADLLARRL